MRQHGCTPLIIYQRAVRKKRTWKFPFCKSFPINLIPLRQQIATTVSRKGKASVQIISLSFFRSSSSDPILVQSVTLFVFVGVLKQHPAGQYMCGPTTNSGANWRFRTSSCQLVRRLIMMFASLENGQLWPQCWWASVATTLADINAGEKTTTSTTRLSVTGWFKGRPDGVCVYVWLDGKRTDTHTHHDEHVVHALVKFPTAGSVDHEGVVTGPGGLFTANGS